MKISRSFIFKYLYITLGTLIAGFALNVFLIPNQLAVGGVSGLATALNHLVPIPVGIISIICNVPLYIIGIISEGKNFAIKSVYATFMLAVFIDVFSFIPHLITDLILASVFGGVLTGLGYGMVLQKGATTGGSDIVAKLINKKRKHISMGNLLFIIDILVIAFATVVFKNLYTGLYSVVALYMSSKIIDLLIEGVNFAKLAFVISSKSSETAYAITHNLERGATFLSGRGVFTNSEKNVVMCTLKKNEITRLKNLVSGIDKSAFVIITDAREVLGEGFMNI